ncbi:hypothetical protein, partial [Hyphomonas sp.]|uniref:hypothetical protein n=1 Tax=Hyphomonas sp. TaxID=87 RepID=UPI001BCFFF4C
SGLRPRQKPVDWIEPEIGNAFKSTDADRTPRPSGTWNGDASVDVLFIRLGFQEPHLTLEQALLDAGKLIIIYAKLALE